MTRTEKWRDKRETMAADRFDVNEAYETLCEEMEQIRDRIKADIERMLKDDENRKVER